MSASAFASAPSTPPASFGSSVEQRAEQIQNLIRRYLEDDRESTLQVDQLPDGRTLIEIDGGFVLESLSFYIARNL